MSKLITFPSSPVPQPPRPSVPFLLRLFKRIIAIWKSAMAAEYSAIGRLPAIVPDWWNVERVLLFASGGKPQPTFTATIGERITVRRNTMAAWGLVA